MISSLDECSYIIEYEKFKGPINLLLELVRKKKVDIYEIRLSTVIKDFLNYIKSKKDVLLDTLSGFLYVASVLLEIKSKTILPSKGEQEGEDGDSDLINTDILRRREEEYKIYKKISTYINELYKKEELYFIREAPIEENFLDLFPDFLKDVSIESIHLLASKFLKDKEDEITYLDYIYNNSISKTIFEEINRVKDALSNRDFITFKELTKDLKRMIDKIICFLSILELYKNEFIDIIQFESFGGITIKKFNGKIK